MTKSLLNPTRSNNQLPTLVNNNVTATSDIDKANMLNDHFCKQSSIDDANINPPQLPINHDCSVSNIVITSQAVKDAILHIYWSEFDWLAASP